MKLVLQHPSENRLAEADKQELLKQAVCDGIVFKNTVESKNQYREEFERFARANFGELSALDRQILAALRIKLGVLPQQAAAIKKEVLKPYKDYNRKLQRYQQLL